MNNQAVILREWQEDGVELRELDDHILELHKDGILIARFSSTCVTVLDITKEIASNSKRKEMN